MKRRFSLPFRLKPNRVPVEREKTVDAQTQVKQELYLKHHALLDQLSNEQQTSFDKTLITLASGALGLSIAFADRVATEPIELVWTLVAAWISFGLALIAILISFLVSVYAMRREQDNIRHFYHPDEFPKPNKNWWAVGVIILNNFSLIAFIFGVVAFIAFAAFNISP